MPDPDLSGLYRIQRMMGAAPFAGELKNPDGIKVTIEGIIFRDGLIYMIDPKTGEEHRATIHIKYQKHLTADEIRGRFKILKIFERHEDSRKIHLGKCSTIKRMIEQKEFFKYHANNRYDHIRQVLAKDGEQQAPLKMCRVCLKQFESVSWWRRTKMTNDFDFKKFFEKKIGGFSNPPKSDTAPADDYPKGWGEIRRNHLDGADCTCECCGLKLRGKKGCMDVHHINKMKSDCRPENLQALCKICHAAQPHHGHMPADMPLLSELRIEQGLPKTCPNCRS